MEESSAVLYNPFLRNDRLHLPSFIEAFGDLLKNEQENLKKLEEEKDKQNKTKSNLKPSKNLNPPLQSIDMHNKLTHSNVKSTTSRSNNACTPIPITKKKKRFKFSNSNNPKKTKNKSIPLPISSNNNNFSTLPITPILVKYSQPPSQITNHDSNLPKSWIFDNDHENENENKNKNESDDDTSLTSWIFDAYDDENDDENNNENENKNKNENKNENKHVKIMVTPPVPKHKTQSKKKMNENENENENKNEVLMMSDIMSPMPANRFELNSPALNDKNAQLFSKPVDFTVCMPPTPMIHGDKKRIAMEERKNNEFFKNHKPLLTPAKLRENRIKLYNPNTDMEATMLLDMMPAPFDDDDDDNKMESNPFQPLDCDLSMISPINNVENLNHNKNIANSFAIGNIFGAKMQDSFHTIPININNNNNDNNNKLFESKNNSSIEDIDDQFSSIKLNKSNKSIKSDSPSSFHKSFNINGGSFKSYCDKNDSDDINTFVGKLTDDLQNNKIKQTQKTHQTTFMDDSFLSIHPLSDSEFFSPAGRNELLDQSTQTHPVLIFDEHDIPKITYNGKLIDISSISNNRNTPVLRHNKDTIHAETYQYSDSDNEVNTNRNNNNNNNNISNISNNRDLI